MVIKMHRSYLPRNNVHGTLYVMSKMSDTFSFFLLSNDRTKMIHNPNASIMPAKEKYTNTSSDEHNVLHTLFSAFKLENKRVILFFYF